MLEAAREAMALAGDDRAVLDDRRTFLALTHLIEIVGEAARNLSERMRGRYPEITWREIAATRNRLIHGYFSVDLDVLWDIVHNDLPQLIPLLETAVSSEEGQPGD